MCHGSKNTNKTIRFKTDKPREAKPYKRQQKRTPREWEEDNED